MGLAVATVGSAFRDDEYAVRSFASLFETALYPVGVAGSLQAGWYSLDKGNCSAVGRILSLTNATFGRTCTSNSVRYTWLQLSFNASYFPLFDFNSDAGLRLFTAVAGRLFLF